MRLHQPRASQKEKAAPPRSRQVSEKQRYVRRQQDLQIFRQLGDEVSALRHSRLCPSQVAKQPQAGKPGSLLMAREAWRAASSHRNPAELWREYPAEGALALHGKYFSSVGSRWSLSKLMLIAIYASRGRGITSPEGKLGQETLMHTNQPCNYSKARDLHYLQKVIFISYLSKYKFHYCY